ncbi:MAG TPA: hypothetical protein VGS23_09375 [Thermoplasmata archaeon]|nr:hypothetical protein [Thermoplasmata archaeon]
MSEPSSSLSDTGRVQATVLRLYQTIAILMLLVIGALALYAFRLGPLVGPGVEESFGIAVALMFLASAMLVHLADRTYRVWPEGRRVRPVVPALVTDRSIAFALKILLVALVAGSIAYVIATLVT